MAEDTSAPMHDMNGQILADGDTVEVFRTTLGSVGQAVIVALRDPLEHLVTVDHGPTGYAAPHDRSREILWAHQLAKVEPQPVAA